MRTRIELIIKKPTKTLGFFSFRCEQTVAHVNNITEKCIREKDARAVVFRYMQSRFGAVYTFFEVMGYLLVSLIWVDKLWNKSTMIADFPALIIPAMVLSAVLISNVIVNMRNLIRYTEIVYVSDRWLKDNLGNEAVVFIKNQFYDRAGLFKVTRYLDDRGVAPSVEKGNMPSFYNCEESDTQFLQAAHIV